MKLHLVLWLSVLIGAMGTPAWADPPSNLQVFTSSGSFTVPSGVTKIEVEVRGGGGGGGGSAGSRTSGPGQGGCGGGYGKQVLTVTAGSTHAVTVGVGGAGGAFYYADGTAGGTSTFGTLISATGGGGGRASGGAGCAGGTSTAVLNMTGFGGDQSGLAPPFNRGGLCGDGSTRGSGGRAIANAVGSPGATGNVVVRW